MNKLLSVLMCPKLASDRDTYLAVESRADLLADELVKDIEKLHLEEVSCESCPYWKSVELAASVGTSTDNLDKKA